MEFNIGRVKSFGGGTDIPEVGAIFMANRTTKIECLERKLFGFPLPQADFVKKVKSGMILFLFEYEERKLYGVFQAISDGTMDIMPHAYKSSGKQYPAQVRFKSIWNCKPLTEHEFGVAIKDNYYERKKFNFGLSEDQVSKLLYLFDSKMNEIQKSRSQLSRDKYNRSLSSDFGRRGEYEEDERILRDNHKSELTVDTGPVNLARSPGLGRPNLTAYTMSDKSILETESSTFGGPYRLSSLERVNSQYSNPFSNRPADGVFPSSRTKVVDFHLPAENSNPPPIRLASLSQTLSPSPLRSVASMGADFVPVVSENESETIGSSMLPPQSVSSGFEGLRTTKFEFNERLTLPESSLTTIPSSSRHLNVGREIASPFFGSCEDPPYVPDHPYIPDHYYPASLQHEGGQYFSHQPSSAATSCTPQLYVGSDPIYPRNTDIHRKQERVMPTKDDLDENGAYSGLRSDTPNNRKSVFSRLARRVNVQDDDDNIGNTDHGHIPVEQIMDMVRRYQKNWNQPMEKNEHHIDWNDVDACPRYQNMQGECEDAPLDSEEQQCNDAVIEKTLNFGRRSKIRKMQGEMGGSMEGSGSLSGTLGKRRKILRPSFVIVTDNGPDVAGSSQEVNKDKGPNCEAFASSNGGEVNENKSSQSFDLQSVVQPDKELFADNGPNVDGSSQEVNEDKGSNCEALVSSNGDKGPKGEALVSSNGGEVNENRTSQSFDLQSGSTRGGPGVELEMEKRGETILGLKGGFPDLQRFIL